MDPERGAASGEANKQTIKGAMGNRGIRSDASAA